MLLTVNDKHYLKCRSNNILCFRRRITEKKRAGCAVET